MYLQIIDYSRLRENYDEIEILLICEMEHRRFWFTFFFISGILTTDLTSYISQIFLFVFNTFEKVLKSPNLSYFYSTKSLQMTEYVIDCPPGCGLTVVTL